MKSKKFSPVLLVYAAIIVLMMSVVAGCGGQAQQQPTQQKPVTIKLACVASQQSPQWIYGVQVFKDRVEKNSGGRVVVEAHSGGSMGSEREIFEGIILGNIQAGALSTAPMSAVEPRIAILELPYLIESYDLADKIFDGPIGEEAKNMLLTKGVRVLAWMETDFRQISNSKRSVASPEDLKGLKIRVPDTPSLNMWFRELGADPTPIPFPDIYPALQQKVVDGQDNGVLLTYAQKFFEVQPHLTLTNHCYYAASIVISDKFYQGLPDDLKQVVSQAAKEAAISERKGNRQVVSKFIDDMKKAGVKVVEPTAEARKKFQDSAIPVYRHYKKAGGPSAEFLEKVLKETGKESVIKS
ncbi:MAG: TRAP transporter substrate-binding protein [Bacillota bacterium]